MMQILKYNLDTFFTLKIRRLFTLFCLCLCLGGCENDGDTSLGEDSNFKSQASCWQTTITNAVLRIINTLYNHSSQQVVSDRSGATIIMLAFAIWMAFKLLKILASFKEENLGEVWTEIGHKLFLCAFCAYLVSQTSYINYAIQTFIVPIYRTLLELGVNVLNTPNYKTLLELGDYKVVTFSYDPKTCSISDINVANLQQSIKPAANCLICTINDRLNTGIRIGITLICSLRLSALLVGLLMVALFTVAKFGFVLFIIDSLFRLNFAAYLLPVLIVGVPFSFTRKWSKAGLLMFLNSSGVMMFMGILVTIVIKALETLIDHLSLTEDNIEGLGPVLLSMVLISMLLINIPGMAVSLADKFVEGGGSLAFQKKISKFIINSIKKAAAIALDSVSSGVSESITQPLEKYEQVREVMDNIKQKTKKINSALNSMAGYNDDD